MTETNENDVMPPPPPPVVAKPVPVVVDKEIVVDEEGFDCPANLPEGDTNSMQSEDDCTEEITSSDADVIVWPSVFYCLRTHTLLVDPVVGPDGNSIDLSSVDDDREQNSDYYPNRALQAIMQETMFLRGDSLRASLKQLQNSVTQGLSYLLPESTTANEPLFRQLNDAFYCPITFNLMHDPCIDPEGNTFERVAVENWIRVNQSSPITRTDLQINQLYPNNAIKKLLDQEKEKPEDQMHPAIRKWKDERAPMATDIELGGMQVVQHELRQNQNIVTPTSFIVITTSNGVHSVMYPTTPSEWTEREHARRRSIYQCFGVFFALVCLMGFIVYGSLFFLMLFLLVLIVLFSRRSSNT